MSAEIPLILSFSVIGDSKKEVMPMPNRAAFFVAGGEQVGSFHFNSPIDSMKEGAMKVMVRSIMKVVPGKMAEAMELEQKHMATASRVLGISPRCYRPVSGDFMNTIIYESEWDSLAAFEAHPEKMMAEPEMQALFPKLEAITESYVAEFYTPMP